MLGYLSPTRGTKVKNIWRKPRIVSLTLGFILVLTNEVCLGVLTQIIPIFRAHSILYMSHISLYVHLVWGTRNREPLLTKPARQNLFNHIRENAKAKNIFIDHINGHIDHVHCLVSLNADQSIAEVAKLLKGESSYWANNKSGNLFKHKIYWSQEYYAASIGLSGVDSVRKYIQNQEEHHRHKTFTEECADFMRVYGWQKYLD